jgi:hypothetical protein
MMIRRSFSLLISKSDASAGSGLPSARFRRRPLACALNWLARPSH